MIEVNNIAMSLAQQVPPPSTLPAAGTITERTRRMPPSKIDIPVPSSKSFPASPAPSQATLLAQSQQWAEKALDLAGSLPTANKTEECDIACAVATHNLGEIAQMMGDINEARSKFEQAKAMSTKLRFAEGVGMANDRLKSLKSGA
jgi:hypothetical protein